MITECTFLGHVKALLGKEQISALSQSVCLGKHGTVCGILIHLDQPSSTEENQSVLGSLWVLVWLSVQWGKKSSSRLSFGWVKGKWRCFVIADPGRFFRGLFDNDGTSAGTQTQGYWWQKDIHCPQKVPLWQGLVGKETLICTEIISAISQDGMKLASGMWPNLNLGS
jgi:hypothetical protein